MNEQLSRMKAAIEARVKAEPAAVGRTAVERRAARRDASPHRGNGTLAASDDGLANAGSDRSVAPPKS